MTTHQLNTLAAVAPPMQVRVHSSPALLGMISQGMSTGDLERRELLGAAGELLGVEVWEGPLLLGTWGPDFDRALRVHPATAAAMGMFIERFGSPRKVL